MPTVPRVSKDHAKFQDFAVLEKLTKRDAKNTLRTDVNDLIPLEFERRREGDILAARVAYALSLAEDIFGSRKAAADFLKRRHPLLGATPLEKLETEWGGREVERILQSAIHGLPV